MHKNYYISWQSPVAALTLILLSNLVMPATYAGGVSPGAASTPQASVEALIVKLRPAGKSARDRVIPSAQLLDLSTKAGKRLAHFRSMSGGAEVLRLPQRVSVAEAQAIAQRLKTDPGVEYAEPDLLMQPALLPNDPQFVNQWHYKAPNDEIGGANLPGAWDITQGAPGVVTAVIDTGILPHVEFSGRLLSGYDFIVDTSISNDGDGRDANPVDPGDWTASGECYVGSPARNSSWHGTHVAGTVGAAGNNGQGVSGINWVSKILPVRVLGKCGGYVSDVVDAMRWAAGLPLDTGLPNNGGIPVNNNPARVLNLSLSGAGACGTTYQNAINDLVNAGKVIVVAAGNSNQNVDPTATTPGHAPGNCTGVITVSAINRSGGKAYYSNFGNAVEIAAPGGAQTFINDPNGILSTLNSGTTGAAADDYRYYQGTSMAAPHVAGLVSLMLSANPGLTPAQVLAQLQNNARPFPTGTGGDCTGALCGAGIINAAAAVGAVSRLLKLSTDDRSFADTGVGLSSAAQSITVTNTNNANISLTLGTATLSGTHANDFVIGMDNCSGITLAAQAACQIHVSFHPSAAGARNAQLTLPSNAANGPHIIALSGTGTAVVTGTLQFSTSAYRVSEAVAGAVIRVTRSGGTGRASVRYATTNGTASAGVDYTATSGTLTWAAGDTTAKTFTIPILGDTAVERNETVSLTLTTPSGATVGTPGTATLTLVNDDTSLQFSAYNYGVNEGGGTARIKVTRKGRLSGTVSVAYATANGTATAPADYGARNGTLTFASGVSSRIFGIPIVNDTRREANETVTLKLSTPGGGATLGTPTIATLRIINND